MYQWCEGCVHRVNAMCYNVKEVCNRGDKRVQKTEEVMEKVETIKEKIEIVNKILEELSCVDCEYSSYISDEFPCNDCSCLKSIHFEAKQKQVEVDFAEAFKAYKNNKIVESVVSKVNFEARPKKKDLFYDTTAEEIDGKWIIKS